jgi:hypothetical protein
MECHKELFVGDGFSFPIEIDILCLDIANSQLNMISKTAIEKIILFTVYSSFIV